MANITQVNIKIALAAYSRGPDLLAVVNFYPSGHKERLADVCKKSRASLVLDRDILALSTVSVAFSQQSNERIKDLSLSSFNSSEPAQ